MTLTDYFLLGLATWLVVLLVGEILFRRAMRREIREDLELRAAQAEQRWRRFAGGPAQLHNIPKARGGYIDPRRENSADDLSNPLHPLSPFSPISVLPSVGASNPEPCDSSSSSSSSDSSSSCGGSND